MLILARTGALPQGVGGIFHFTRRFRAGLSYPAALRLDFAGFSPPFSPRHRSYYPKQGSRKIAINSQLGRERSKGFGQGILTLPAGAQC